MSSTDKNNTVDVQAIIDSQPVARVQWRILLLCFLVTAIDGLDTAAIGFIAPALREHWQIGAAELGPVLGAALIGLMLGAFMAGPLADRFGRKRVLLGSVACFGVFSLAAAFAQDLQSLALLRLLTGLGLGGAMPNAITLTSEYCPQRRRSLMVTGMFCGFTLGSALGGVVAAQLLPLFGWRSVLALGGVLPLALLPVLMLALPESVRYLARSRPGDGMAILQRIGALPAGCQGLRIDEVAEGHSPVRQILAAPLRRGTLALWLAFFMSLLIIYGMTNWLPLLVRDTGLSLSQAALVSALFQIGGTLGALCLGAAMDRFDSHQVLVLALLGGAGCLFAIGQCHGNYALLGLSVAGMGFCISGSQVGANALAAAFYPTSSRATGVSWAHGVGRIGSVCGTFGGAWLMDAGLSFEALFGVLMLPAVLAAAAIFFKGVRPAAALPANTHITL
ncbi:aromatic acid/H+ symport family MFS transporter [Pseudomonas sp. CC120222-01a]|uniref:MFS transporter n=1 Tax=Pseudomonas sp. CC120222-01a TaxID=1378075 RepID=UPI000D8BFBED|nr:aromatic acid/H+ symport family MFS transporter [Pseudomonas sp. CC120222-01a]PVZ42704.1 AAHS family 4-hydroxybenzoate transporter-like MFS transporter [Pseudomonas sp. CC120222-01a]